jgi:hypothetical protein
MTGKVNFIFWEQNSAAGDSGYWAYHRLTDGRLVWDGPFRDARVAKKILDQMKQSLESKGLTILKQGSDINFYDSMADFRDTILDDSRSVRISDIPAK